MIFETLSRLESVFTDGNKSIAWKQQALQDAEHVLTPLEFQLVTQTLYERFAGARQTLQGLFLAQLLADEPPARYVRKPIMPDVTLFHDPDLQRANKCIVFAFCGTARRLMIPTGVFLQLLPRTGIDVVTVNDPRRNHFALGITEYAPDFLKLATRLAQDFEPDKYKSVYCFGTSMGGFASLRCGLLLGTKAISVGGRFTWHIDRIRTRQGVPAFDPLCACKASDTVKFNCVYGAFEADVRAVNHLATIFPVTRVPIPNATGHNVIFRMWKDGTLRQFYREQFVF